MEIVVGPLLLIPCMCQAATDKESVDEEAYESLPSPRISRPASAPGPIPRPGATELLIRPSVSPERMRLSPPTETIIGQVHSSTASRDSVLWSLHRCLWCQEEAMLHSRLSAALAFFHEPYALPPARA
jgi:hypothetical protein